MFRTLVRVALVGFLFYGLRLALKRWVEGPEPVPWSSPSSGSPAEGAGAVAPTDAPQTSVAGSDGAETGPAGKAAVAEKAGPAKKAAPAKKASPAKKAASPAKKAASPAKKAASPAKKAASPAKKAASPAKKAASPAKKAGGARKAAPPTDEGPSS